VKFTLSWLKEYLDTHEPLEKIADKLTMIGLEVEHIGDKAKALAPFVIAKVISAEQHPKPIACAFAWSITARSPMATSRCRWSAARRMRAPVSSACSRRPAPTFPARTSRSRRQHSRRRKPRHAVLGCRT
jgi:hypothetical protein